jgi:hypothetical protein
MVAAVVSLAASALLPPPAAAQRWGRPSCLAPNGVDDTAELQSALDKCSGAASGCTVRLCRGVFRTTPLRVGDFRGVLRGDRRGRTVIQALPDLRVNDNPNGYWRDDPLNPGLDPWPFLIQLVGGRGEIRDLTVEVPTPPAGFRPTQGWIEVTGTSYELAGALLLTGHDPVDFEVNRVRVIAGPDPESFLETTLISGISFRGLLFNPADPGDFPVHPVKGRCRLSESEMRGMVSGTQLGELEGAEIEIRRNAFESFLAVDVLDGSRSRVGVYGNEWDVGFAGVQVILNVDGEPSRENRFTVSRNRGTIGPYFGFGTGIYFADPWLLPEPGESTLALSANRMTLGTDEEAASSAVEAFGPGQLWAWGNRLRGRAAAGIKLDETSNCRVFWNALASIDTGGGAHLDLGPRTSECLAFVGPDDIVVDDGKDNRIIRR